jgi:hypothetical protein
MTQVQQIHNYLWSVAPNGATNAQIAQGTGITSHQGVYMTTQHLLSEGRIRAERAGRRWLFFAVEGAPGRRLRPFTNRCDEPGRLPA